MKTIMVAKTTKMHFNHDLKFMTPTKDYFKAKPQFGDNTNKSQPYTGHKYNL